MNATPTLEPPIEPHAPHWLSRAAFPVLSGLFFLTQASLGFAVYRANYWLAAPLVLDLARLVDLAHRRGERGTLPQLAPFFKTPLDVEEQDFASQMDRLARYAAEVRAETKRARRAGA